MRKLFHILGTLWALPFTIICWVFYILPFWLIFGDFKKMKSFSNKPLILILRVNTDIPSYIPWHIKRWKDFGGMAVPNVIIYRDDTTPDDDWYIPYTIKHEYNHNIWMFILGPIFPFAYGLSSLIQWAQGKDKYRDNWFERTARRYAGQKVD